jgi:predicted nucleic acid-binding protein
MNVLLDTNIIIHREAGSVINPDIGILFKWLDTLHCKKCIHPVTIDEIEKHGDPKTVKAFKIKMSSYEIMKTVAPQHEQVIKKCIPLDKSENDLNDSKLLNELLHGRVDIFISEDKNVHRKAELLGISDRVFFIDAFLEKVTAENPKLQDYKVLSVKQELFGNLDLSDPFFLTLKDDYHPNFEKWFNGKANECAYICKKDAKIVAFLYVKPENQGEDYSNITPVFTKKKRLKIGTLKVDYNGLRLGERFLKIAFDNALKMKVEELYVTTFNKRPEQERLIVLLESYGFKYWGKKNGGESVYVRDFQPGFNPVNPRLTYPYVSSERNIFLIPIYPDYHTDLLPDSILRTESPRDYEENEPHRNSIMKSYISRSIERGIRKGDVIIFYRTAEKGKSAYHSSCITTIAVADDVIEKIADENDFIMKCRKRSVFTDEELKKHWNWKPSYRPFIINFLYVHSFGLGNRLNRHKLMDLGIVTGAENELRGLKKINRDQFKSILKETNTDERLIVD